MIELDDRRLNVPDNLAMQYASQVDAALAQMTEVEKGSLVNRDEKRAVGHYWLRRPEIAPQPMAADIRAAQERIAAFVAGPAARFKRILLIGIGGSALGPQFLVNAFRQPGKTPPIFFL